MTRRFFITALVVLAAAVFGGIVQADDGVPAPPTGVAKPSPCFYDTLIGSEDMGYGAGSQCITGGDGANAIGLYAGDDWADGRQGTDSIYGGDDHDVIYGGKEGDSLFGERHNDTLLAGCPGGCDVSGRAHFDVLKGGDGDDILGAQNGEPNDVLDGGNGNDVCYGGRSDTFTNCETKHVG